jgi:hypothetical protein
MIIASNIPAKHIDLELLLLYGIYVLDPVVENDYCLVFVGTNFNSENRPSVAWLRKAYGVFNRKYVLHHAPLFSPAVNSSNQSIIIVIQKVQEES